MQGTTTIKDWIARSVPDYYIMFVKAWLPFNAWYMTNLYSEDDNLVHDRDIVYHVMTKSNLFRDRLHALIIGTDEESVRFKEHIACLSIALDKYPLPSVENQLSFSRVCIENNPNARKTGNKKVGKFTCTSRFDNTLPKTAARWILEVLRNSGTQTLGIIELHKCLESELAQNAFYQSQSDTIKEALRYCLNAINPDMHTSVKHVKCGSKNPPHDGIVISIKKRVYFINNTDYVCRAIIRILYELRCKLFHGEIDPHDDYLEIYEYAFYIQRTLNQSIL